MFLIYSFYLQFYVKQYNSNVNIRLFFIIQIVTLGNPIEFIYLKITIVLSNVIDYFKIYPKETKILYLVLFDMENHEKPIFMICFVRFRLVSFR